SEPCAGAATAMADTVNGSPSGSLMPASSPGASCVSATSSSVVNIGVALPGGRLAGSTLIVIVASTSALPSLARTCSANGVLAACTAAASATVSTPVVDSANAPPELPPSRVKSTASPSASPATSVPTTVPAAAFPATVNDCAMKVGAALTAPIVTVTSNSLVSSGTSLMLARTSRRCVGLVVALIRVWSITVTRPLASTANAPGGVCPSSWKR